ncbi:hypothetical protein CPB84DRAFT_1726985 [Gymnopilus junonius]|uniref:ACB domain-containing protein n=1 Tax=Gymnopilus junonius TaxID=109634 RepID=A0A9P5N966_GYMJU|nr:hypothetical protein CPB84DRAFT_1717167 [Gymnopilus junonius]KAF8905484.1 hypothetical protein CPB84DRAFT_1726985 [Gymnopilus junonius]
MSDHKPSLDFQNAAAYLASAPSLTKVSTVVKLELYGAFKCVTCSRIPSTSRPSIFDMTGRAKWDAWSAAGKKFEHPQDAEKSYLEMACSLGWTPSAAVEGNVESNSTAEDDIWDKDEVPPSAGSGGMGNAVSTMAPGPEVIDKTIHGLALSNDVPGLNTLLDKNPDTNLNVLDEYGYAPIHLACDRGNTEIVKILLAQGADRNIKDPDDLSPLELSKEAGHSEIEALLSSA